MFPFTNNGSDPISYGDQLCYSRPISNDITTDPKHEESLLSFFHFPSPFIPFELGLDDVFLQQSNDAFLHHQQPLRAISAGASQTAVNMMDSNTNDIMELTKICHKKSHNRTAEPIPRKRSSKRDRHSKINTAQGPRDRRMRLSLKVAREFFDLQDKLGFDKASKTVEWLLIQSRHEIKKICNSLPKMDCSYCVGTKSASSTSECEVVSGIDETSIEGRTFVGAIAKPSACAKKETSACAKKERKPRPSRKTAFQPQARESREKARARARERTREKLWNRRINVTKRGEEAAATHEMNNTGRWSSFEKGEESGSQSHEINPPMEVPTEIEAPNLFEQDKLGSTEDMIDETLVPISNWSPSTYFNHLHNPGILQQECQSSDLPVLLHIVGGSYNIQSLG